MSIGETAPIVGLAPVPAAPLLAPGDVARRLNVSRSMAYSLIKSGKLRALRIGRLPRVSEDELGRYLAAAAEARRS